MSHRAMHLIVDGIVYGLQKHGGINTWFNQVLPRLAGRDDTQVDLLLPSECRGITPSPPVRTLRRDFLHTRTGLSWTLDQLVEPRLQQFNSFTLGLWVRSKRNAIFQSTYLTYLKSDIPQVAFALDMNHELFPQQYNTQHGLWLRRQYPEFLRRAVRIIAISNVTKEHVTQFYNIDPSAIDVVQLATDPRDFFVDKNERSLRFLQEDCSIRLPYILYLGERTSTYKNFSRLLEAFLACRRDLDLTLVVAGPEWGSAEISRLQSLDCHDRIRLIEYPDTGLLRILYNYATAFVYPSIHEGFGIPLLEAMACGTPVIASSIAVFREIADMAAIYFDPNDTADLVKAIEVSSNEKLRASYVALGLEQVKKYSWDRCANEMLATYQRALAGG